MWTLLVLIDLEAKTIRLSWGSAGHMLEWEMAAILPF
jgi:hypothetical protein